MTDELSQSVIEQDWITMAGLRAIAMFNFQKDPTGVHSILNRDWRCGYVEVPSNHPLFGVGYEDECEALTKSFHTLNNWTKRHLSVILSFFTPDGVLTPQAVIVPHGGLTYSGNGTVGFPIKSDGWWFGFDCDHFADRQVGRNTEFVVDQCEDLAKQIAFLFPEY